MDFFFPQTIFSSYRGRLMLHIVLLPPSTFLFTVSQDDVHDKETCSTCYHSILFSVVMHVFALLMPLTG